jgi:hypothetical protein
MNRLSLTSVEYFGSSVADAYTQPGQLLISAFGPVLNTVVGDKELLLSALISTAAWLLLLALALKAFGIVRRVAANMKTAVATRISNIRTSRACHKRSEKLRGQLAVSDTELHFDNLDLAVLNSAATLGPGLALTAPDLAAEFDLRPPKVQDRLEKLATNMMLVRSFGSPEDYQAYRLSRAGAAFLSMWNRRRD